MPLVRMFRLAERTLARIARRPALGLAGVGLFSFTLTAALALLVRMPIPVGPDELSVMFGAKCYALGLPCIPTHPMWVHLETLHIIQQPTCASKFPPAQAIVLATGLRLTGQALVGMWVATALASVALAWMLMGWLPPRWGLLGGLLAALNPLLLGCSQNYTGGAVIFIGSALVVGCVRRLARRPRVADSLLLGLGLVLLASSRPWEGMVLSLACLPAALVGIWRNRSENKVVALLRAFAPMSAVLAAGLTALCWLNLCVTGSPFRLPYAVYMNAYDVAPPFLWQPLRPEPVYRHEYLRYVDAEWAVAPYLKQHTWAGFLEELGAKLSFLWSSFFSSFPLQVGIFVLHWLVWHDRWARFAAAALAIFTAQLLTETWVQAVYAAPAIGLVMVLTMLGLRRLFVWRYQGRPLGRWLVRAAVILSVIGVARLCISLQQSRATDAGPHLTRIVRQLTEAGGRHLILERRNHSNEASYEWVYNEPDIDSSAIVWARAMDAERDRELLEYYKDRQVWYLTMDEPEYRLIPYRPYTAEKSEKDQDQ
jgi:hypothetical protein